MQMAHILDPLAKTKKDKEKKIRKYGEIKLHMLGMRKLH